MTQTPRQLRARELSQSSDALDASKRQRRPRPRRTPPRQSRGVSRTALLAAMIVVLAVGAFAAPFAQYYFGPRLAELSGIDELAAGQAASPDFSRLRALEQQAEFLSQQTEALARDAGGSARVDALENELQLLRTEIEDLTALAGRTAALEENAASLRALEARLDDLEAAPPSYDPSADLAAVGERIARVEAVLGEVRDEGGQLASAVDALQTRLAEDLKQATALLEARVAALEEDRGDRQLGSEVADLRDRTGALEAALGQSTTRSALVVALGNLRVAAERGRPFDVELQAVRSLAGSLAAPQLEAPLDSLAGSAATGLPTIIGLERAFVAFANRAAQGAQVEGNGWVGRTLTRVSSLVSIRRTGDIKGDTPEAVVARAELHLGAGELAAAVDEMTKLRGQSGAVDQWLDRAGERLAGERALDEIGALILTLGGAG